MHCRLLSLEKIEKDIRTTHIKHKYRVLPPQHDFDRLAVEVLKYHLWLDSLAQPQERREGQHLPEVDPKILKEELDAVWKDTTNELEHISFNIGTSLNIASLMRGAAMSDKEPSHLRLQPMRLKNMQDNIEELKRKTHKEFESMDGRIWRSNAPRLFIERHPKTDTTFLDANENVLRELYRQWVRDLRGTVQRHEKHLIDVDLDDD